MSLFVSEEEIPRKTLDDLIEESFFDFTASNGEILPIVRSFHFM